MVSSRKIALYAFFVAFFICEVLAEDDKRSFSEMIFAKNFLKQYHYLSPQKSGNHDWKTAIQLYQEFMQLPVTGKLDDATFKEMKKPRCGFADLEEDEQTGLSKRYGVSARPWTTASLTYGFVNYCEDMPKADCKTVIAKAFKLWSDSTVLTFKQIPDSDVSKANIKISFVRGSHMSCNFPFDGKNGVLAHAMYPIDGSIHFDEDEKFSAGIPGDQEYHLLSVAAHEIGHAIGVAHTNVKAAMMFPEYKYSANPKLDVDDKNAVAYLYGGGTVKPQITQPANCADSFGGCLRYQYLCGNQQTKDSMKKYCPNTCGHCSTSGGQISGPLPCSNIYQDSWCQGIIAAYSNACKDPSFEANCKKSCNPGC